MIIIIFLNTNVLIFTANSSKFGRTFVLCGNNDNQGPESVCNSSPYSFKFTINYTMFLYFLFFNHSWNY